MDKIKWKAAVGVWFTFSIISGYDRLWSIAYNFAVLPRFASINWFQFINIHIVTLCWGEIPFHMIIIIIIMERVWLFFAELTACISNAMKREKERLCAPLYVMRMHEYVQINL